MLRARAISALCRFAFADVLMGASYTPEELGAEVNEEGEVVGANDAEAVEGEVVDEYTAFEEPPRTAEHERILDKMADEMRSIQPDKRPDKRKAWDYAFESIPNARKALERLQKLAEKYPAEDPLLVHDDEPEPPAEENGKATPDQVARLTELADEIYEDKDFARDGHEWLQREKGKPFSEMSRAEADAQIAALEAERVEA
jgi:hypothetical protein